MARLLAIALLLLTSCATTRFLDAAGDFAEGPTNEVSSGAFAVAVVIMIPLCLAWDVATFPAQILGGYPPYGDSEMEQPEEVSSEPGQTVLIKPETVGSATFDGAKRGDVLVRFSAGVSVVLIEEKEGFARVRLPSGIAVWVSSNSIRQ